MSVLTMSLHLVQITTQTQSKIIPPPFTVSALAKILQLSIVFTKWTKTHWTPGLTVIGLNVSLDKDIFYFTKIITVILINIK